MSVRSDIADLLTPKIPYRWKVVTTERDLGVIDRTTVKLSQQSIVRHPSAPMGHHLVEFLCRVIVPGADFDKSEDRLDEDVQTLLFAINTLGGAVAWSRAEKVSTGENLAYDITLTVTTDKPKEH